MTIQELGERVIRENPGLVEDRLNAEIARAEGLVSEAQSHLDSARGELDGLFALRDELHAPVESEVA